MSITLALNSFFCDRGVYIRHKQLLCLAICGQNKRCVIWLRHAKLVWTSLGFFPAGTFAKTHGSDHVLSIGWTILCIMRACTYAHIYLYTSLSSCERHAGAVVSKDSCDPAGTNRDCWGMTSSFPNLLPDRVKSGSSCVPLVYHCRIKESGYARLLRFCVHWGSKFVVSKFTGKSTYLKYISTGQHLHMNLLYATRFIDTLFVKCCPSNLDFMWNVQYLLFCLNLLRMQLGVIEVDWQATEDRTKLKVRRRENVQVFHHEIPWLEVCWKCDGYFEDGGSTTCSLDLRQNVFSHAAHASDMMLIRINIWTIKSPA